MNLEKENEFKIIGNVCIFGDSIVWGAWDKSKNGWVNRLNIYFAEKNKDINIYNLGIASETTSDLLKRVEKECEIRKPGTIIIAIGINDTIYLKKEKRTIVEIHDFEDNLEKIKNICSKYTNNICFLGLTKVKEKYTNPIAWDDNQSYFNNIIEKYNESLRCFCINNRINFLDMYDILEENNLCEDGIHPNESGHKKIFNRVIKFYKKEK